MFKITVYEIEDFIRLSKTGRRMKKTRFHPTEFKAKSFSKAVENLKANFK